MVTGCGGGDGHGGRERGKAGHTGSGGYPVTVTDCAGAKATFSPRPRKIVASNAAGLELLPRLGAGTR